MRRPLLLAATALAVGGCTAVDAAQPGRVVISEVMADPRAVPDGAGEWIEVHNPGAAAVDLRGWTLASARDAPHVVSRSVVVPARGSVVLARSADRERNGGVAAAHAWGGSPSLANAADWVALRDRSGVTVDSVAWGRGLPRGRSRALRDPARPSADVEGAAWTTSTAVYGAGDRGTPGAVRVPAPAGGGRPPAVESGSRTRPGGAVYRDHLEMGVPTDGDASDDFAVRRPQYALSYNPRHNVANWVSWNLNASHYGAAPRRPVFSPDPALPPRFARVATSDYTGSGYSRGHMVRSEERTATARDNAATFLLTNVLPQTQELNGGPWLRLEEHLQRLAQVKGKEMFVMAGGTFPPGHATLNGRGKVAVPATTWKIVVVLPGGRGARDVRTAADVEVIAVEMPNARAFPSPRWQRYRTTVDALERKTGYDFLAALPDPVERVVEAR